MFSVGTERVKPSSQESQLSASDLHPMDDLSQGSLPSLLKTSCRINSFVLSCPYYIQFSTWQNLRAL